MCNPPYMKDGGFIREGRCTQKKGFWGTLWPPISLAYIAAVLENNGYKVLIKDCCAEGIGLNELLRSIHSFKPGLFIFSTSTPTIKSDLEVARIIKELNIGIKTAAIGTHVSALPSETLSSFYPLDYIIRNEPEVTVKALVRCLDKGDSLNLVKGLSYRDINGEIINNPPRDHISDLDQLPFPAWNQIDRDKYRLPLKGDKFLMIAPSRGCPYGCTFCTCHIYYGKKHRKRSSENIIDEMEWDIERFGIKQFFFWADTFTLCRDHVLGICKEIENRGLDVKWACSSRVDTVDSDMLKEMARAGCWMISYGIESGNQKILDNSKKGSKVEDSNKAVRYAKEAGIKVVGHFILGLPGENSSTLKETLALSKILRLDFAQFYYAVPFPGSELYDTAQKEGWLNGVHFQDFRQDRVIMKIPTISKNDLIRGRKKAIRKFYLNFSRIFGILKLIRLKGIWPRE